MSQEDEILKHLRSGRSITPLEALSRYDCLRLAARINDLRAQYGPDSIMTEIIKKGGKRFARYHPIVRRLK